MTYSVFYTTVTCTNGKCPWRYILKSEKQVGDSTLCVDKYIVKMYDIAHEFKSKSPARL